MVKLDSFVTIFRPHMSRLSEEDSRGQRSKKNVGTGKGM